LKDDDRSYNILIAPDFFRRRKINLLKTLAGTQMASGRIKHKKIANNPDISA